MNGRFVWHELRASDLGAAARFYGDLLGWTFTHHAMGMTIRAGDTAIGGVSATKPGIPDHWTPYVAVPDVDVAAAAARAAGGIVTSGEPADIPGIGRLAPILDPHKAIFLAVTPEPGSPLGSPAPGPFVWHRLRTPGPAGAAAFYRDVLGWTTTVSPDATAAVAELPGGTRVAEMLSGTGGHGWLPFVRVDSADPARARAESLGATSTEPTDVPGTGRFTVITDPLGAELALHEPRR